MKNKIQAYWHDFCEKTEISEKPAYAAWSFGNSKEMADALSELVKLKIKTATTSIYEPEEELPEIGEYNIILNVSGDEVDAIIEFKNGDYAAFEIKLSDGSIQDALDSLSTFYKHVAKKPAFMCVIVGHLDATLQEPKTGIYIVPITALRA